MEDLLMRTHMIPLLIGNCIMRMREKVQLRPWIHTTLLQIWRKMLVLVLKGDSMVSLM